MKKAIGFLLILAMMFISTTAMSEDWRLVLDGKVVPGKTATVLAPFGGRVEDFSLRVGDAVKRGEALFTLSTEKIYAPESGTIKGLRAQPGDDATYIQEKYGALTYIEPSSPFVIETSVSEAYDDNENRIVHVGEHVYLRSVNNYNRTGEGFITKVDGKDFSVEVTGGNLRFDETASIHREEKFKSESRIGRGRTKRNPGVAVTGEGSVLKVHVSEGDEVRRGQLLIETVTGTLPELRGMNATISSPLDGVIAQIDATAGSAVEQDQTLCVIHQTDSYQIAATVSELDLNKLSVGDAVEIEFPMARDSAPLDGVIASISAINSGEDSDAEYTVYIDFDITPQIREGMSVSVRIK